MREPERRCRSKRTWKRSLQSPQARRARGRRARSARVPLSTKRGCCLRRRWTSEACGSLTLVKRPSGMTEELAAQATEIARRGPARAWTSKSSGTACGSAASARIIFPDPDMFGPPSRNGSAGRRRRRSTCATRTITGFMSISRAGRRHRGYRRGPRRGCVCLFARGGGGRRVVAIEPHPVSFQVLREALRAEPAANVTALNYACVDGPARLQIETLPVWESNYVRARRTHAGEPSGGRRDLRRPVRGARHRAHRLPEDEHRRGRAVGAARLPRGARPRAFCLHRGPRFPRRPRRRRKFRTLAFVREFLTDAGFELVTRDDDPRYYVPYHVHGRRRV